MYVHVYIYVFLQKDHVYLLLEFCRGGELYRYMQQLPEKKFNSSTAAFCIYRITEALIYLHDRHIIHRDIKPENILIGKEFEVLLKVF